MLPSKNFNYSAVDFSSFQGGSNIGKQNNIETVFKQNKVRLFYVLVINKYLLLHNYFIIIKIYKIINIFSGKTQENRTTETKKNLEYLQGKHELLNTLYTLFII